MNKRRKHRFATLMCLGSVLALSAAGLNHRARGSRAQAPSRPPAGNEITLSVAVTDQDGNPVSGLSREAFHILDGKESQGISSFINKDVPASVAIIVDLSGSVGGLKGRDPGSRLQLAIKGLSRLVESGNKSNEYFIIGFNDDARLIARGAGEASIAALNGLASLPRGGQSAFFDACRFGMDRVTLGAHQKKAIILITDGEDTYSRHTLEDIRRLLKERGVVCYAVDIGEAESSSYAAGAGGPKVLDKLANDSGGLALHPGKDEEVQAGVERIAADLRALYQITFNPLRAAESGKCNSFRVKVVPPGNIKSLTVRSRQSHCPSTMAPR